MSNYTPSGKILLLKNIDLDSSYNNSFTFENVTAQYNFFYSKKFKELTNGTYQRKNSKSLIVDFNADEIRECKYLMWQNSTYSTKWYYAFVLGIDYENPKTSIIRYELDVIQTYLFDVQWNSAYIEREHPTHEFNTDGTPVINTLPEDLDYGSNYKITYMTGIRQARNVHYAILSIKKLSGSGDYSSYENGVQTWVVPFYIGDSATEVKNFTVNDTPVTTLLNVLKFLANDTSYVNTLVSAYITSFIPANDLQFYEETSTRIDMYTQILRTHTISGGSMSNITVATPHKLTGNYPNWEYKVTDHKYSHFPEYEYSKLYMYPYSYIEITNRRGDTFIVKPEYILNDSFWLRFYNGLGTKQKMAVAVKDYLNSGDVTSANALLENALIDNSQNLLTISDSYTASYLQSNSNALASAEINARLSRDTAQQNAQATLGTALQNAVREYNIAQIGADANVVKSLIESIGTIGSALGGDLGKIAAGMGSGIGASVGYAIQDDAYLIEQAVKEESASTNSTNTYRSAATNYQTEINSINAKKRDAQQIPPTISQLGGDVDFDLFNGASRIYVNYKTVTDEYREKLEDYFKMYGYKVNRLTTEPGIHKRTSWDYIKLAQCSIKANIPMDDLMAIQGIYLKGITFWHGDYIGQYNRDNSPL